MQLSPAILLPLLLAGCVHPVSSSGPSAPRPAVQQEYPHYSSQWKGAAPFQTRILLARSADNVCTPVVCLKIDGVPEYFFLDTGSDVSSVRKGFLRCHKHRETLFQCEIDSFRRTHQVDVVALLDLDLGFAVIKTMPAMVIDDADLASTSKEVEKAGLPGLSGVLGLDFLTHFDAIVDLGASAVILKPGQTSP